MIPQARGQDLVTLLAIEPLLMVALLAYRARPLAATLAWAGALSYVLYTYAMYSYTTYFNALFLVYVALFSASLFALIDLLAHLDPEHVRAAMSTHASHTSDRWVLRAGWAVLPRRVAGTDRARDTAGNRA